MQPAFHRLTLCVLLSWCNAAAAHISEEEDLALIYGDNSTVSIATGAQQTITRAPSSATVITSLDIKAMGATGLEQILSSVPGLHVSMSNIASGPIYSFRGVHTSHNPQVLMLVNGIPITNVFMGDRSQLWGGMPLENVARIEVIRGPGSALYGADAFSGVINVITKTAKDIDGTEYGVRIGSFNTQDAWIQHGGKLGVLDASFYLGAGRTDGQKGIFQQDAQTAWDAIYGTRASLAPGPVNAQNKSLDARMDLSYQAWRLRSGYQHRELGSGAGLAGALDPNARVAESRLYLDASYEQTNWLPGWDVSAVAGYYDIKSNPANPAFTLFPAGAFGGAYPNGMIGNPGHSEQHTHASVTAVYSGFEAHRIRTGTGFRVDDLYQTREFKNFDANFFPLPGVIDASNNPAQVFLLPHKRNVGFAFVQDEYNFAQDWTLTAGVRHDRYSDFGGTTNPRLALVWDASYNIVIKAMHGTAFRSPSFAELYSVNNPVTVGNPSLKPETITTDELGFSWQPVDKLKTSLNFFRYRIRNSILPVGASYLNSGGQSGRGFEFEASFEADRNLRLTGNLSVQHSKDGATGQDAGMAPHQRTFARADWRFVPLWQLGVTVNNVRGRMREPGDTRPLIPDYATVDLTLRREKVAHSWELSIMARNLFNADAREPTFKSVGTTLAGAPITLSDLPLPGRVFYLQLQHGF
jgi:iron complex outermembrane receptor protein